MDHTKERHSDARTVVWIDNARRDLRYAARSLARNPAFSIIAIVTLALGIGANTAIFSIVHAVILSPLPFKNADQLVQLYENVPAAESANGKAMRTVVFARDVIDLSMHARTLSHVVTTGNGSRAGWRRCAAAKTHVGDGCDVFDARCAAEDRTMVFNRR